MGWARIVSNLGEGSYTVTVEDGSTVNMDCIDYTVDIPVGTKVGTIEINRATNNRFIKPGRCSWRGTRYNETVQGAIDKTENMSAPSALLSYMLDGGAKKWRPLYCAGSVQSVNESANTVYVASSGIGNQSFAQNVYVDYMSQHAAVFTAGDEVIIKMVNGVPFSVIGFTGTPLPDTPNTEDPTCGEECDGEANCDCCVDPSGEGCAEYCTLNPDDPLCIAIANDWADTDCATICTPCSTARSVCCATKSEGASGCTCNDDPCLTQCGECCEVDDGSIPCMFYCNCNPDDIRCEPIEPVNVCGIPDGYLKSSAWKLLCHEHTVDVYAPIVLSHPKSDFMVMYTGGGSDTDYGYGVQPQPYMGFEYGDNVFVDQGPQGLGGFYHSSRQIRDVYIQGFSGATPTITSGSVTDYFPAVYVTFVLKRYSSATTSGLSYSAVYDENGWMKQHYAFREIKGNIISSALLQEFYTHELFFNPANSSFVPYLIVENYNYLNDYENITIKLRAYPARYAYSSNSEWLDLVEGWLSSNFKLMKIDTYEDGGLNTGASRARAMISPDWNSANGYSRIGLIKAVYTYTWTSGGSSFPATSTGVYPAMDGVVIESIGSDTTQRIPAVSDCPSCN